MRAIAPRLIGTRFGQLIKEPVRGVLERAGYDVVPLWRDETDFLGRLLRDLDVDAVLDVGANQGQYARRLRVLGYQGPIVSFEPGRQAYKLLRRRVEGDPRWEAVNVAVGRHTGTLDLNVSANSVSSSMLRLTDVHVDAAPESVATTVESVPVVTLDQAVTQFERIWLKVDTQGYELEVLAGAKEVLRRTRALQIELSLAPLYAGQASPVDVLRLTQDEGFQIIDLIPGFRSPTSGHLLQCDVIAVRC